jgi:hypothetical protein
MKDILTSPVKSQMPKFEVGKSVCAPYSRLRNLGKEVHVRIREFARVFAINDGILSFVNNFQNSAALALGIICPISRHDLNTFAQIFQLEVGLSSN